MKFNKMAMGVLVLTTCTFLCVVIWRGYYRRESPLQNRQVPPPKIHTSWASQHFVKVELDRSFFEKLDELPKAFNSELSEQQKGELEQTLRDLVAAHNSGSYQDYLRFRKPVAAKLNSQTLVTYRAEWEKIYTQKGKPIPENYRTNPEGYHEVKWEKKLKNDPVGYWNGICISNSALIVFTTNALPRPLKDAVRSEYEWGALNLLPSFDFERNPRKVLDQDSALTIATVSLLIQPRDPDPATIYSVRFYWDRTVSKWLPWEYVVAFNAQLNRTPLF